MSDVIVSVVGAGVIGTSIGLALKRHADAPQLVVHDKDPKITREAMKLGAFDKSEWNLINATEPADLIVLALPSSEIRATLEAMAPYLKKDAIVTDTAQTKQDIVTMAGDVLPEHIHFVGGNPIVTADPGPENAQPDLFENSLYCLTPSAKVLPDAVQLLEDFVSLIGATSFYLDPSEHDGLMSGVHTLPTLLGISMVQSVSRQPSWNEMRRLAGGLFAQVSAGVTGDPDSLAEEIIANHATAKRWVDLTIEALQDLRTQIEAGDQEALAKTFDKAIVLRHNWHKDFADNKLSNLAEPLASVPADEPGMFQRMFGFGNLFGGRRRNNTEQKEDAPKR